MSDFKFFQFFNFEFHHFMRLNFHQKVNFKTTALKNLSIKAKRNIELIPEVFTVLKSYNIRIHNFELSEDLDLDLLEIKYSIRFPTEINIKSLFFDIYSIKGISKINIE